MAARFQRKPQYASTYQVTTCVRFTDVPLVTVLTESSPELMWQEIEPGELIEGRKKTYGDREGPDAVYVKLISSVGHKVIVKREYAVTSITIKAMLSDPGQFAENEINEVGFREISSQVLSKVCMYFTYKVHYTNSPTEILRFATAPQIAPELLMTVNFLDC
ncbi:elongin-C-like [Macaca thibetana thibetana]|uniref:elongin-C-like n=1 Tax=Macaca thibetana thibetana TaxID=257877 RepID=UPI0021BCE255|nr:elongin-C-like [Macaca thibetana thibetana]